MTFKTYIFVFNINFIRSSSIYFKQTPTTRRLHSLIRNCGVPLNLDSSRASPEEMSELLRVIGRFPAAVEECVEALQPCVLVHYLHELSSEVSRSLKGCNVKRSEKGKAQSYLLAFHCAKVTLANGLRMLGVKPLDEM